MRRSAALPALLVLLAGAALAPAQDKLMETPYYPLAVGNTWTYRTTTTGGSQEAATGRYTSKVARLEKVRDVTCARVEMLVDDQVVTYEHIRPTEDGIYRYSFAGTQPEQPVRFFKLPPEKGATWTVETKALGEALKGTFTMGEEEVEVGGKKYKAFTATSENLDASGLKFTTTYYLAEGVGIVKQVIEVGTQKTVIELDKFEPAKKAE